MILAPVFAIYAKGPAFTLILGFILGLSMGYFSGYPIYGSELWPTALRASGMGIGFMGIARAGSTAGPALVGALADETSIATAISIMAGLYIVAIILVWALGYETKGKSLEELEKM